MEKKDSKKEETQTPATRELFLSADTSERVPERMMDIEESKEEKNEKDENEE